MNFCQNVSVCISWSPVKLLSEVEDFQSSLALSDAHQSALTISDS